jgi:hypothetical protein
MHYSKDESRAESHTREQAIPVIARRPRRLPDGPGWITCSEGSKSASPWTLRLCQILQSSDRSRACTELGSG